MASLQSLNQNMTDCRVSAYVLFIALQHHFYPFQDQRALYRPSWCVALGWDLLCSYGCFYSSLMGLLSARGMRRLGESVGPDWTQTSVVSTRLSDVHSGGCVMKSWSEQTEQMLQTMLHHLVCAERLKLLLEVKKRVLRYFFFCCNMDSLRDL